jgi:hypothetical protein
MRRWRSVTVTVRSDTSSDDSAAGTNTQQVIRIFFLPVDFLSRLIHSTQLHKNFANSVAHLDLIQSIGGYGVKMETGSHSTNVSL